MTAGNHRHDGVAADPELVEAYREKAAPLIERAIINRTHTVPWLANRTRDCKTVFIDRDVPIILPKCGVDTDKTLPWHEIPECLAMDDGLSYDEGTPSAHADVATPLERQAVEKQGASWQEYSDEMDGYIRAIDAEKLTDIPDDLDIRPFVDEGDKAIIDQVLAARHGGDNAETMPSERSRSANVTKILHKLASGGIETLADKRQVVVAVSSANPDRVGDIVVQEGIDCGAFMRLGGTVLWQHNGECPIAKCVDLGVADGKLTAKTQFPPAGVSAKADEIYGLICAGVVNAASIGFSPVEWNHIDPKDPWGAQRFDKTELMEFSFVSVPANPDAAIMERSQDRAFLRTPQKKAAESWKCGASRNLPIGGDAAWDGPAAEKSIFAHCNFDGDHPDYGFARKAFLAYDDSNPKLKGSYKLPFAHVVDGRLTAMPSGIRAAASRLPQADIPDEVQTKARAVLDHYEAKMKDGKSASLLTIDLKALSAKAFGEAAVLARAEIEEIIEAVKAGRVLSEENMAHVQAIQKCFGKMMDCQTRALDSHGQTYEDLQQFVNHLNEGSGHAKELMKSSKKPKPKPSSEDDQEDPNEDDSTSDDPEADVELAAAQARQREIEMMERALAP